MKDEKKIRIEKKCLRCEEIFVINMDKHKGCQYCIECWLVHGKEIRADWERWSKKGPTEL